MKIYVSLFSAFLLAVPLASCSDEPGQAVTPARAQREPVVFMNAADSMSLTRAAGFEETTSDRLASAGFNVGITTPAGVYASVRHASYDNVTGLYGLDGGGVYYPESAVMTFYAAYPGSPVVSAGGAVLPCSHSPYQDIVVAKAVTAARPTVLAFEHVLSRLTVRCTGTDADVSYRVTGVSVLGFAEGEYDYATGVLTGGDAMESPYVLLDEDVSLVSAAQEIGSKVSFIPGTVTVRISWDCLFCGLVTASYTRSADVVLEQGRRNVYTFKLPNDVSLPLSFTVSIASWEESASTAFWTD